MAPQFRIGHCYTLRNWLDVCWSGLGSGECIAFVLHGVSFPIRVAERRSYGRERTLTERERENEKHVISLKFKLATSIL